MREMVAAIQAEARDHALLPQRASELMVQLTALLGNIADEMRAADLAYAEVLVRLLDGEEAASRAKIRAEVTPEYQRKREARDVKELALELVRSLKMFVRAAEEELRELRGNR